MILIDLTYINSPGGITLSRLILNEILYKKYEQRIQILLDQRNHNLFETKGLKKAIIKKREISRYFFYKENIKRYKSVLCFANVPPPFKISKKVFIYFHNELLLDSSNVNIHLLNDLLLKAKKFYIKNINNNYNWIVQTDHIKYLLKEKLKIKENKIDKCPIYPKNKGPKQKRSSNTFIYPSSNNPHKNNNRLIEAFIFAAKKTDTRIKLKITVKEVDLKINRRSLPSNLKIECLGILDYKSLLDLYATSKFLIFPSLRESFGLPLIEGIQAGCIVLAPELNYAKELINPAYSFDAYDYKSISRVILKAIKNKTHKLQSVKVKNNIDEIFKKLINV